MALRGGSFAQDGKIEGRVGKAFDAEKEKCRDNLYVVDSAA